MTDNNYVRFTQAQIRALLEAVDSHRQHLVDNDISTAVLDRAADRLEAARRPS